MTKIAAIQMASGAQVQANLMKAETLIQQAVSKGAEFVVLPENFAFIGSQDKDRLEFAETFGTGIIQSHMAKLAKQHGIWLLAGAITLQCEVTGKAINASILYNDQGEVAARYDKIHLFDAALSNGETYAESETTLAGNKAVVVDTPFGRLGIAICYDLRFPELFREMSEQGAEIVAISAAFTETTGKAHWEVLLRARAIENLSFVIAAGQGGYHINSRSTYGHSMIVDYWGNVREVLEKGEGVILSDIDLTAQKAIRESFPVLNHRKLQTS